MTPQEIGQGAVGLGLVLYAIHNTWTTNQAKRKAEAAAGTTEQVRQTTEQVQRTLTTNNGGSHMKDAIDRIEARQVDQGESITLLRQAFTDHLAVSARTEAHLFDRIERAERRRPRFPFL